MRPYILDWNDKSKIKWKNLSNDEKIIVRLSWITKITNL